MTNKELLEEFKTYLYIDKKYSKHTITSYTTEVDRYLSFLNFQRKISACLFFFFFFSLSMGKAYDAWNCSHCPVTMWEQPQDHEDADPKPGHCRATKPILEMPVSRLLVR